MKHVLLMTLLALAACAPKPPAVMAENDSVLEPNAEADSGAPSKPKPTATATATAEASPAVTASATATGKSSAVAGASSGVKAPETGPGYREFNHDVTRGHNDPLLEKSGIPKRTKRRVILRVYPTLVSPQNARNAFAVEDTLWTARTQVAQCYYAGPGRDPTGEQTFVGTTMIDAEGKVISSQADTLAAVLTAAKLDECVFDKIKQLKFGKGTAEAKATWEFRFKTVEGSGLADFKELPIK